MPAIRVRPDHFSGASKLHTRDVDGLAAMVRGLAIDNARRVCEVAAVGQFVDNSTGTAVTVKQFTFPDFTIPTVAFNATAAGGVQQAAWNTSVSRISNAHAVLAETINKARGRVGLPLITFPGSIVTSGTVPAVDLTATTSSGVAAVDFASFVASTTTLKQNHRKLVRAFRQVEAALGLVASTTDKLSVNFTNDFALVAPATVTSAATGASSVAVASGTAILADIANNIATMALYWNETLIGAGLTVLTDNSTGTPAITHIVTTLGTMTPFTTAGVDCAPKAGVDTQLALYANAIASLAARLNLVSEAFGTGPVLTDSTGGTATTTLAAMTATFTAVTGGTACLDAVSALARWNAVKNNIATLIAAINVLAPNFGVDALTDNSGGVASTASPAILAAIPATATGTSGATLSSIANTEAQTDAAAGLIAIATMAAAVNVMLGANADYRPLSVVAA